MRALVVYESMYGTTHVVASNVADGLRATHQVTVVPVAEAGADLLASADLLVVGGPIHMHGMSSPMTRRMAAKAAAKPDSGLSLDPDAAGPRRPRPAQAPRHRARPGRRVRRQGSDPRAEPGLVHQCLQLTDRNRGAELPGRRPVRAGRPSAEQPPGRSLAEPEREQQAVPPGHDPGGVRGEVPVQLGPGRRSQHGPHAVGALVHLRRPDRAGHQDVRATI